MKKPIFFMVCAKKIRTSPAKKIILASDFVFLHGSQK
jgi:hypothetical protein